MNESTSHDLLFPRTTILPKPLQYREVSNLSSLVTRFLTGTESKANALVKRLLRIAATSKEKRILQC